MAIDDDGTLLELIGLIYDAALDASRWPDTLSRVADAVGAQAISLDIYDAAAQTFDGIAPRTDPDFLQSYAEYWAARNQLWALSAGVPVGKLFTTDDFMPRDQFIRSEFYNDWCRPQGKDATLATNVLVDGASSAVAAVYRPWDGAGSFADGERKLFAALTVHLQRAVQLHLRTAHLSLGLASSFDMLNHVQQGVLLVDPNARLLFANTIGESLLAKADGLLVDHAGLCAATPAATARLRGQIRACRTNPDGGRVSLPRREGRSPVEALILPFQSEIHRPGVLRPAAIVFLTDTEHALSLRAETLRKAFALTPAEAAFVLEIVKGDGRQAAADRLGISVATARTHLMHVFEKTGVRRQAELVRLVLETSGTR
jgi:DNA-binding CsgD family transcriptional regulator